MKKTNVLIIAAHPDDEVLGCGGTAARLIKHGHEVAIAILGEGITSRDTSRDAVARAGELGALQSDIISAAKQLGVSAVRTFGLPDNRFDSVPLLDVVKIIEELKSEIAPSVIFTHFAGDLNVDHEVCNRAVLTATRPMQGECVKEIYAFEVMSSTEWKFPLTFSPNMFIDISEHLEQKLKAMACYRSESRSAPHPRSPEGIAEAAKMWGTRVGVKYAEAFQLIRRIVPAGAALL